MDTMCNFYLLVGSISVPGGSEKSIIAAMYVNNWASDNLSLDVVFVFLLEK